jgi:hypothetical protein
MMLSTLPIKINYQKLGISRNVFKFYLPYHKFRILNCSIFYRRIMKLTNLPFGLIQHILMRLYIESSRLYRIRNLITNFYFCNSNCRKYVWFFFDLRYFTVNYVMFKRLESTHTNQTLTLCILFL